MREQDREQLTLMLEDRLGVREREIQAEEEAQPFVATTTPAEEGAGGAED